MPQAIVDPRALRTFLAVCRESSISGAARILNILLRRAEAMDGLLRQAHQEVALARDGMQCPCLFR